MENRLYTTEDRLAEDVSYWLSFLTASSPLRGDGFGGSAPRKQRLPLSHFNKADPFMVSRAALDASGYGEDWFCFGDAQPKDVDYSVDVCCLLPAPASEFASHQLVRTRSVSPKECRGLVDRVFPVMVESACASFLTTPPARSVNSAAAGGYITCRGFYGWSGGKWVSASSDRTWSGDAENGHWQPYGVDRSDNPRIQTALGIQFNRRYEWLIEIGDPRGLSLILPTDPGGAKDIFLHRDAKGDRRDALHNWVREHYRRKRSSDGETATFVRKHLRGATAFTWHGMECTIYPSEYDIDALNRAIDERAAMRKVG